MSENVIFEVADDNADAAPAPAAEKPKKAKRELSAEQKQALVERLKKAREAKASKRNSAKKDTPAIKSPEKAPEVVKEQKQEIKEEIKEIKQDIKEAKTDGASNAELAALMKQLDRLNGNLEKLSKARTPKKVEIKEPPKQTPTPKPQASPSPTPQAVATPPPTPEPKATIVYNLKNQRRRLF